jgi:hypothetical protein
MSIMATERPLFVMLVPTERMAARAAAAEDSQERAGGPRLDATLEADTLFNESVRRTAIHEYLAEAGLIQPDAMTKWLYREVLHADLDDPWLGLEKTLFENYPFDK